MSIISEIKEMAAQRLAFRLWLVKEEPGYLLYTDKRSLLFIRIMTLFFSTAVLAAMVFIATKDAPLPAYLILGFFFVSFFFVFILKSFSHKEVSFSLSGKKIIVLKKRFSTVLTETQFGFGDIKKLDLFRVTRTETKDGHGQRQRTHYEMVMEFNDGRNIHFSVINDRESALASANKLVDLTGAKLISKI
jgi:hypothetical protein